ncbi:uncharacterized protein LOC131316288 [Rhododendron vialii]|uniref:uncharacterized protein LOC131316288 n=1 Tax=Rhododendron vialii TaxID=182163 RepID=UPI00265E70E0|nr:uncharacterized protein LOC131316288 [Rhododendron vialii]
MYAALLLLRYLKTTPGEGILLSSSSSLQLTCYSSSDWASCPITRRFRSQLIINRLLFIVIIWLHCTSLQIRSFMSTLNTLPSCEGENSKVNVPSKEQCPDIFTKALRRNQFSFLKSELGMINPHASSNLRGSIRKAHIQSYP